MDDVGGFTELLNTRLMIALYKSLYHTLTNKHWCSSVTVFIALLGCGF
jgi:hypothetical protein